jgi:TonB family protein
MRGENRAIAWSVIVHVLVVAAFVFVPREWLTSKTEKPKVMTISLSGSVGPRTGGISSLGGQAVTKVEPPPKRPEPKPVAAAKPEPAPATIVKPTKPEPTPANAPPAAVNRPPITGREIVQGSAKADTGVKGTDPGLAQGGGGGAQVDDLNFCCPEYLGAITTAVLPNWNQNQPERGSTKMKFVIRKDGTIANIEYEVKSGSGLLDREAFRALSKTRFPPLPSSYPGDTLTVHLLFVYKGD